MIVRSPSKWTTARKLQLYKDIKQLMKNPATVHLTQVSKHVGMTTHALYALSADHPDVGEFITHVRDELESRLVVGGLTNTYNAGFVKFLLSAKYGFVEKSALAVSKTETFPDFGDE